MACAVDARIAIVFLSGVVGRQPLIDQRVMVGLAKCGRIGPGRGYLERIAGHFERLKNAGRLRSRRPAGPDTAREPDRLDDELAVCLPVTARVTDGCVIEDLHVWRRLTRRINVARKRSL